MSDKELATALSDLRRSIRQNEFLKAGGGLQQTHLLSQEKKQVARILTEINKREKSN